MKPMNDSIKILGKKMMRYPITIWMVVSVFTLCTVYVAFSAYNGTADVKRVVSTQATSKTVFSSNYLEVYSEKNPDVNNLRTTNEGNYVVSITVCNYDQLDPTTPAKALINYSLMAELVKYNDATSSYERVSSVQMNGENSKIFYVQKTMDNNEVINADAQHSLNTGDFVYTYPTETLAGGMPNKDTFDICFDAAEVAKDVPELFIRVTATPTPESVQANSGISTLQSTISISQGRSVETGWHGRLQETTASQDYDGYNLVIEGSGAGTIDILWDNSKFAMNPAFVMLNSSILTDETDVDGRTDWKKMTLSVDSMNSNRYVVQFYKRNANVSYTGLEFPSRYIYCDNYIATVVTDELEEPENP